MKTKSLLSLLKIYNELEFSKESWSLSACSYCSTLGNTLCLFLPVLPGTFQSKLCLSTAPRAGLLILQSKTSIVFWNRVIAI